MRRTSQNRLSWWKLLLKDRFGEEFECYFEDDSFFLTLSGSHKKIVFDQIISSFEHLTPSIPHTNWFVQDGYTSAFDDSIPAPGVEHLPEIVIEHSGHLINVHYDIMGLAFWALNRLEEINYTNLDEHGRFPYHASHAYKHGYLERPVVDEWMHILEQVIRKLWPELTLKSNKFSFHLSHDVDRPFQYLKVSFPLIAKFVIGDIVKRRNLSLASERFKKWCLVRLGFVSYDPFNTFDWIMDCSEKLGITSHFYFICGQTDSRMDSDYDLEDSLICELLQKINSRGHKIGVHPSYNTYRDQTEFEKEVEYLRQVCKVKGIKQSEWGGRMHYLRWEHPTTLRLWASANIDYDSTLGYPNKIGFRCGTCHKYKPFDIALDEVFEIEIRPLIAMEAALFLDEFGSDTNEHELEKLMSMLAKVRQLNGEFTLLWHNSELTTKRMRQIYYSILSA